MELIKYSSMNDFPKHTPVRYHMQGVIEFKGTSGRLLNEHLKLLREIGN